MTYEGLYNKLVLAKQKIKKIQKKYGLNIRDLSPVINIKEADLWQIGEISSIAEITYKINDLIEILLDIKIDNLFMTNFDFVSQVYDRPVKRIPKLERKKRQKWEQENARKLNLNKRNRKCCNCGNLISDWAEPYQTSKNKYMCSFACYKNQLDYIFYLNLKFGKGKIKI